MWHMLDDKNTTPITFADLKPKKCTALDVLCSITFCHNEDLIDCKKFFWGYDHEMVSNQKLGGKKSLLFLTMFLFLGS